MWIINEWRIGLEMTNQTSCHHEIMSQDPMYQVKSWRLDMLNFPFQFINPFIPVRMQPPTGIQAPWKQNTFLFCSPLDWCLV